MMRAVKVMRQIESQSTMSNIENLIWIDLEMTGLVPETDDIIEIATIVTDKDLNILAEGPALAVNQPEAALARMEEWNQRQHGSSGLASRVRGSRITVAAAEQQIVEFLTAW